MIRHYYQKPSFYFNVLIIYAINFSPPQFKGGFIMLKRILHSLTGRQKYGYQHFSSSDFKKGKYPPPHYPGQPPYPNQGQHYQGQPPYPNQHGQHPGQPPYPNQNGQYNGQPPYPHQNGQYNGQPPYPNQNGQYNGQPPYPNQPPHYPPQHPNHNYGHGYYKKKWKYSSS